MRWDKKCICELEKAEREAELSEEKRRNKKKKHTEQQAASQENTRTPSDIEAVDVNVSSSSTSTSTSFPIEIHLSFNRPNLTYEVIPKPSKTKTLDAMVKCILEHRNETGIIYCLSRKSCQDVSEALNKRLKLR